jgi:hypothetical protein
MSNVEVKKACAICGAMNPGHRREFLNYKGHTLCSDCYVGLGMFKENLWIVGRVQQFLFSLTDHQQTGADL